MMLARQYWNKYLPLLPREARACKPIYMPRLRRPWKRDLPGMANALHLQNSQSQAHQSSSQWPLHGSFWGIVPSTTALSEPPENLCPWSLYKFFPLCYWMFGDNLKAELRSQQPQILPVSSEQKISRGPSFQVKISLPSSSAFPVLLVKLSQPN